MTRKSVRGVPFRSAVSFEERRAVGALMDPLRRDGRVAYIPLSLSNGFHEKALSVKADVAALAVLEGP